MVSFLAQHGSSVQAIAEQLHCDRYALLRYYKAELEQGRKASVGNAAERAGFKEPQWLSNPLTFLSQS